MYMYKNIRKSTCNTGSKNEILITLSRTKDKNYCNVQESVQPKKKRK